MLENKIVMFDLLKITMKMIEKEQNGLYHLEMKENEEKDYLISQPESPLFDQLSIIRDRKDQDYINDRYKKDAENKINKNQHINMFIPELIFIEARYNKKTQKQLTHLLKYGLDYNNTHYKRFGKSASQAKAGITVFIKEKYYEKMMERSQLGVNPAECVISKYESQRCLIFSSCHMIKADLPYIVVVDEFTKIIPHQHIRYANTKDVKYKDTETGVTKTAKNRKFIENGYRDIEISPFDGFGIHTEEISKLFSSYLPKEHKSMLFQIRLPYMKGVSVQAPLREYLRNECHVDKIKDIFGKWHDVDKIDCIWNTSMWKGYKLFKKEFGENGWTEYIKRINKYKYRIGLSKYNHNLHEINRYSRMNFQYLQCLDLMNDKYVNKFKHHDNNFDILNRNNWGKIINLASYSTDLFSKIINGDKLYALKFLGIVDESQPLENDSKYLEAIMANNDMLHDPPIRQMLKRKLNKYIDQMKMGKIYAHGFYHIIVGDIIGYLQYCAGFNKEDITGCLNEHEFFTQSFRNKKECLAMRSPLVDPSEVNKIHIIQNDITKKYLNYFKNTNVAMVNMNDISLQQMGGADTDGDIIFITDDQTLVHSKINLPIVIDVDDKHTTDPVAYDTNNIIEYELHSRDSRIGEITNIATSILNQNTNNEKWKKINQDNVALLRLFQGKEIDYLKTGFRWFIPKNLRRYIKKLPAFLLFNYPKRMNIYNKIRKMNKDINRKDERIPYNVYWSPSQLNELCDYICRWEEDLIWNQDVKDNRNLVINRSMNDDGLLDDKIIKKRIRKLCRTFNKDFKENVDCRKNLDKIKDKYGEELQEIISDNELLANYCIKVSYESPGSDKLLCWSLFGDEIVKNIKENSTDHKNSKIIPANRYDSSACEFLGKYYRLVDSDQGDGK
jgi:hypothetical protein